MTKKKSSKKEPVDPLPEAEMEGVEIYAEPPVEVPELDPVEELELTVAEEASLPEYGELEDMLVVCAQCGRAVRVPSLEKLPESCPCGVKFDYDNEVPPTKIVIDEPTTLVVRKVPKKFVR